MQALCALTPDQGLASRPHPCNACVAPAQICTNAQPFALASAGARGRECLRPHSPRMDPMKEQRARFILQALVQGIDPLTGDELPPGTILQQAEVLRALLAGVSALEQTAA